MKNKNFPAFILCLFFPFVAEAKLLYVDASIGDDSIEYESNSAHKPWKTIGRAAWGSTSRARPVKRQAARAGDTVVVKKGTYIARQMSGNRIDPAWNPVNSGESGNPIVFKAEGRVILQSSATAAGGPVIGALERSHITWDGFVVDEPNIHTLPDTGPVVAWDAHYITLENLEVRGKTAQWADNHNSIRLEDVDNSIVRGNKLYGVRTNPPSGNSASIMCYLCEHILIENNEIYDSNSGIYLKGLNPGPLIVRSNFIHDIDHNAIHLVQVGYEHTPGAKIYRNIIKNSEIGIFFNPVDNPGHSSPFLGNIYVVNNTLDKNMDGIFWRPRAEHYDNIVIKNNIISNSGVAVNAEEVNALPGTSMSHNLYTGNRSHGKFAGKRMSLRRWRSRLELDEVGSQKGDPMFINPESDDYKLGKGSEAYKAGIDILNIQGKGTDVPINLGAEI